jgi:hypothetical protein
MTKVERLEDTLSRIEDGRPSQLDLSWCASTVGWLWKWRKISKEQMETFTSRITEQFEMERRYKCNYH